MHAFIVTAAVCAIIRRCLEVIDCYGFGIRRGSGSQLLKAAEEWSKEKGCVGMRLNSGGSRVGAHEFYRGQGYDNEKSQLRFLKMY